MYLLEMPDASAGGFKEAWGRVGDSIVVVGGEGLFNCHIHTNDVGAAIEAGVEAGLFELDTQDARLVAETAVALCDGAGARVVAPGPDLSLDEARTMVLSAVGRLVGHAGPLPRPEQALQEAGA